MRFNLLIKAGKYFFPIILLISTFCLQACKDKEIVEPVEKSVTLDKDSITIEILESAMIHPQFDVNIKPKKSYSWSATPSGIVEFKMDTTDLSVTITAKAEGVTVLTIQSDDGTVKASCKVKVKDDSDDSDVIKILTIGNSFSEDAVENYLFDLAAAEGRKVIIANLYIGGAALSQHVNNATNDSRSYEYRKINKFGNKTNTGSTAISYALADEDWDYISFQQVSQNSGMFSTFENTLPVLYEYVSQRATNPEVKYILHQTWAYAQNSTHSGFANYNNDQMTMYQAIVNTYQQAKTLVDIDIVVPAGTAIQNGRTSYFGDNFTRDGYHLNLGVGRFTAACTWYESLFNKDVTQNSFKPANLSETESNLAKNAAHFAVLKPNEITDMSSFQDGSGEGSFTRPVQIDFGGNTSSGGWNGFLGFSSGTTLNNIKDIDGNNSGVSIAITERFNGTNTDGATTTTTDLDMLDGVSSTSYFGNSKAVFGGVLVEKSTLVVTGLNKEIEYKFCFFGSRMNVAAGESRQTKYTLIGNTTSETVLEIANNNDKTACVQEIFPDPAGKITIEVTSGESNTNSYGFYYLGAMQITPLP